MVPVVVVPVVVTGPGAGLTAKGTSAFQSWFAQLVVMLVVVVLCDEAGPKPEPELSNQFHPPCATVVVVVGGVVIAPGMVAAAGLVVVLSATPPQLLTQSPNHTSCDEVVVMEVVRAKLALVPIPMVVAVPMVVEVVLVLLEAPTGRLLVPVGAGTSFHTHPLAHGSCVVLVSVPVVEVLVSPADSLP